MKTSLPIVFTVILLAACSAPNTDPIKQPAQQATTVSVIDPIEGLEIKPHKDETVRELPQD